MRHHILASAVIVLTLVALGAGCAGPIVGSAGPVPAAFDQDLVGTWDGQFWGVVSNGYYPVEGTMRLQIREDHTFTVTMTPTPAANNIAKASTWSGTVSRVGANVVFHLEKGAYPAFSSLGRSGADTLYGVSNEPSTGHDIGIELERDTTVTAGQAGSKG